MIFPLVPLIFLLGQSPNNFEAAREHAHVDVLHAHAHADNTPLRARARVRVYTRACYGVVQCLPVKNPTIYRRIYGKRKTIAWCPCTPPSTMETFGKKISAEACSGKEIAGLLKKKMMMMIMMKNMMKRKSRNRV